MSDLTLQSKVKLNDGNSIPRIGLGVYEMTDEEAYQATKWALEAGYRLIDTAAWYENEEACGKAIVDFCKESGVPRSEICYTTKLKHNEGRERTRKAIDDSVRLCGASYIDLYLVHGPPGGPQMRRESWEEVVRAQKAGKLRSIGISNFGLRHMEEIRTNWGDASEEVLKDDSKWEGVKPAVNQIDIHLAQTTVVMICRFDVRRLPRRL